MQVPFEYYPCGLEPGTCGSMVWCVQVGQVYHIPQYHLSLPQPTWDEASSQTKVYLVEFVLQVHACVYM